MTDPKPPANPPTHARLNGFWRHRKGGVYRVTLVAIREEDRSECVVYWSPDGKPYVRPLVEFLDGRFTREPGHP